MMEMEFETKEEFLEAVKNTKKPLLVGEITGWTNNGYMTKTVKLSCIDDYDDKTSVLLSYNFFVGREHTITEEFKRQLNAEALEKQKQALKLLEKTTEDYKQKTKAELLDKGFSVFFGNWKTPEL